MKYSSIAGFHGGIHPSDGTDKDLSKDIPIRVYSPKTVWISMKQSAGSGCQIAVQKGDKVTKGQLIGTPTRFGSANIHASISGIVMDIVTMKDLQDNEEQYIVIQAESVSQQQMEEDNAKNIPSHHQGFMDISSYSKEEIITSMKEAGLIGMGGAGFPTHVKYETTNPIDYVLINAAECEPYLTCDHRLMLEYGYDIINGIQLFIKAAGAKKAFICMEDNKKDAAEHLSNLLTQSDLPIEVKLLKTKYPQGGERQLIEAVIGKEVPVGKLPADVGVIINNVGTAKALADLIFTKMPLISRCTTVTGKVKNPGNFLVPIGTRYSELIELAGGFTTENPRVIAGGPMTGTSIMFGGEAKDVQGSVTKTSSGLVVLEDQFLMESPCIRCGQCERVCPAGLAPYKIDFACIQKDVDLCEKLYATECISCGCCSYVCPAKRELAHRTTQAKIDVLKLRMERRNRQNGK